MVKNSTATSRAPGTCMMEGAQLLTHPSSNTMSAYAKSCTTRMLCWRASATIRSKKSSPTHCAVGFDGKPITSIFGLGVSSRIARSSSAKKSTPGVIRTERMSAPAMIAP
jgi:hypothetical protein